MMLRTATRRCHGPLTHLKGLLKALPVTQRFVSTQEVASSSPSLFTAEIPQSLMRDGDALIKRFKDLCQEMSITGSGDKGHDAAVVLASPGLTRLIDSAASAGRWAELLSPAGEGGHFHLVSAVVDHVPSVTRPSMAENEGIAVLRGPSDVILPQLWAPTKERSARNDDVGALTFGLDDASTVTVPLAHTIFQNGKPSTLMASRFDLSGDSPRLVQSKETMEQQINVPLQSPSNPHLWLPLRGLTQPRIVTESFGNILRRLQIDGRSTPASSELEASVDDIYKEIQKKLPPGVEVPLMGVWAVVSPAPGKSANARNWHVENLEEAGAKENLIEAIRNGGRLFKLLSGGGGWGSKAGLLSLDPETSHFPASEEEEMLKLFGNGGQSDFVPVGSEVQFYCSGIWSPEAQLQRSGGDRRHRLVFGVFEDASKLCQGTESTDDIVITPDHFGAISNSAVYLSGAAATPFKLSVPGAQLGIP